MSTPILVLPNFELLFQVNCDTSEIGIGAVLTQFKRHLTYSSEDLIGSRLGLAISSEPDGHTFHPTRKIG